MNTVNNDEKLIIKASSLGKYDVQHENEGDVTHVLVGTPLAYEDNLCANIEIAFKELAETLGLNFDSCEDCDDVSEIRDHILDRLLKANKADIVYGCIEY